jgi:hypothetical protein
MKPTYKTLKSLCAATLLGCALLVVAGCKSVPAPPTEADAKAVYNDTLQRAGLAEKKQLLELKKTDGQESERGGIKYYTFFYEAKVKYLQKIGSYQPGEVYTEKSNYGFQRTERGWEGPNGIIYPE